MKIAVCFSGKFTGINDRGDVIGFDEPYNFFNKNILSKYDVDVYLHGWGDDPEVSKNLIELYKPKKYLLEKQIVFDHPFKHYDFVTSGPNVTQPLLQNNYSRFYSIKKVMELLDGDYDFVLLSRFDNIYFEPFIFENLSSDHFYVDNWQQNQDGFGFNDAWFMSSKDTMIKYSKLYDKLSEYFKLDSDYFRFLTKHGLSGDNMNSAHGLSRHHVENCGIDNVHGLGLEYVTWGLLRRINNRKNPWWNPNIDLYKPNQL